MAVEKITIPDFGDVQEITVVEVYIKAGDEVQKEDPLLALESEKAVMDLPSPFAGTIKEVNVKAEDAVASGDVIATIELAEDTETEGEESAEDTETGGDESAEDTETGGDESAEDTETGGDEPAEEAETDEDEPADDGPKREDQEKKERKQEDAETSEKQSSSGEKKSTVHATPSVRALARKRGVALQDLVGSGPFGRILKEDVMAKTGAAEPPFVSAAPEDFTKYGEIEEIELSRIKKIAGPHLHQSWVTVPHVTHFDETDITDLEAFRKQLNDEQDAEEVRYSPLVFVVRATAATLKSFPLFNASPMPGGKKVVVKKYCHIGIAVDTPNGLVVPVVKDADRKGCREIAEELKRLSSDARKGRLDIGDIKGAGFTISSLGGIGGTGFTPIVSAPQVAILGLSRAIMKPVWDGEEFVPRLVLPFSLSYDHRVIDGADAARFCRALAANINDLKRTLI